MKTNPTMTSFSMSRRASACALVALAAAAFALPAAAHGPTRQKVAESVLIDAPPAKVWAVVGDFAALSKWHPAVAESPAPQGNAVGSVRELKLKPSGALSETLEAWDAEQMRLSYRAKDGGALPVTNYTSTMQVKDEGGKSRVEWRGAFYRGHPGNNPPPELNDDAAVAAVGAVYKAGLANLKKVVEGR